MRQLIYYALIFMLISCSGETPAEEGSEKPLIVCTTGMIADVVTSSFGDAFEVEVLMGPGVDPHLYKATQGDLAKLSSADLILYNGLHLEGKMGNIFSKLSQTRDVYAIAEGVDPSLLILADERGEVHDPHIWFDVKLWRLAAQVIQEVIAEKYPEQSEAQNEPMRSYLAQLEELDNWARAEIQSIPESNRVLITAHDAFSYFGRAYGIEVKGLQGLSTVAEFGLKDVSDMVEYITVNQIPAIFLESAVPPRSIKAVMEGCEKKGFEVKMGGTLFADAMGEEGTEEGSYIGMVKHNVRTIKSALQ